MKQTTLDQSRKVSVLPRARKFSSELVETVLSIEKRKARSGEDFFCVNYILDDGAAHYASFTQLASVVDFINSNFE